MECKRIITPNAICSESALDAVCKLVTSGMKVQSACKFVAEEYQKNYPEDKADWKILKTQYYRANKSSKKRNMLHSEDTETTINIPTVDEVVLVDNTITIPKVDYDILLAENEGLTLAVEELDKEVKRLKNIISPPKDEPQAKGTIDRETVYKFIKDYGNKVQVYAITRDNPTNNRLFNIFSVVIQNCLKTMPPHTLPTKLLEATKIV